MNGPFAMAAYSSGRIHSFCTTPMSIQTPKKETFFFMASGPGPPHYRGYTITLRHTTIGRGPLYEGSA